MNRLHHLAQTLPANLEANRDYPDLEFVLLDYNSTDGTEEYVMKELREWVKAGRLVYYRTTEPEWFRRSHSRNVAFRLARGEIVCNIDADNYTGEGFAQWIGAGFDFGGSVFFTAAGSSDCGVLGRLCVRKSDFLAVGGFDEALEGYGFEDYDLFARLKRAGLRECPISEPTYLRAISHTVGERVANEYLFSRLERLMVRYIDIKTSEFFLLLKDGRVHSGSLLSFTGDSGRPAFGRGMRGGVGVAAYSLRMGYWREDEDGLELCFGESVERGKELRRISRMDWIEEVVLLYSQVSNRLKMESGERVVNGDGFGRARVYQNFSFSIFLM
ncbi:MAG: glycosyltransferase family 2 protein [Bacteroidetes bacterium]|nr:glycosyltransferase family 2 protein [Bacteroidota bacterium]